MSQLRTLPAPLEDLRWFPNTMLGGSQVPIIPVSGNPIPYLAFMCFWGAGVAGVGTHVCTVCIFFLKKSMSALILFKLFHKLETEGTLPNSFYEATVTLSIPP